MLSTNVLGLRTDFWRRCAYAVIYPSYLVRCRAALFGLQVLTRHGFGTPKSMRYRIVVRLSRYYKRTVIRAVQYLQNGPSGVSLSSDAMTVTYRR